LSFRMFPPEDKVFVYRLEGGDVGQIRATSALVVLLFVPCLAYLDLHFAVNDSGLSWLTRELWKRSRALALLLCLLRIWFIWAIWNYVLMKNIDDAMVRGLKYFSPSVVMLPRNLIWAAGPAWLLA